MIASPLTNLLKNDSFSCNARAAEAFESLTKAMIFALVLALPNFKKPFTLETNAFELSMGTILSQNDHPIAYFSRKLVPRMQ